MFFVVFVAVSEQKTKQSDARSPISKIAPKAAIARLPASPRFIAALFPDAPSLAIFADVLARCFAI